MTFGMVTMSLKEALMIANAAPISTTPAPTNQTSDDFASCVEDGSANASHVAHKGLSELYNDLDCTLQLDSLKQLCVTGFWKISLNVTFYNSNIYNQNEERELPFNLKVVTMCSSTPNYQKTVGNTLKSPVIPFLWSQ